MRSTVETLCVSLALTSFLFCAYTPAATAQESEWPEWLRDAMAKEGGRAARARELAVGGDFLTSQLIGKQIGDAQEIDGGWYVNTDIGTDSPVECWVFQEAVDPATMLSAIADASIEATASAAGRELGHRSVFLLDAGEIDGMPYMALEWMYTVGTAPNVAVGLAKARIAFRDEVALACGHNGLGYRKTFADGFEQFVTSAEINDAAPEHYYQEITLHRIGDQPVGVMHTTFTLDADGDTEIASLESALIPVDGSTLLVSDTWRSGYSRPDGTLINQTVAQSENGELILLLSLDPGDTWMVTGTFHGKEIEENLGAEAQPLSELGQMLAVQGLIADAETKALPLDVWLPDADPTRFLEAGIELGDAEDDRHPAQLTLGPLSIAAQFDSRGSLVAGTMQAGAVEMRLERIWVNGALR